MNLARTEFQPMAVAQQRRATLERFNKLRKTHSTARAAAIVGASVPTLWRWRNRYSTGGLKGLKPQRATGGRRSPFSNIRLPVSAAREIERLTVAHGSRRAGLLQFTRSPCCPPVLARYIARTGRLPIRFKELWRVNRVPATVFVSFDGLRLLIKLATAARCSAAGAIIYSIPASKSL